MEMLNTINKENDNRVYCCNCYFLPIAQKNLKNPTKIQKLYKTLPPLDTIDKLIIPLNISETHWVLFVTIISTHHIIVFDSIESNTIIDPWQLIPALDTLRKIFISFGKNEIKNSFTNIPWLFVKGLYDPLQKDELSCGIFLLIIFELKE